ncbi:MAG: hypothetical protein AAGC60_12045 [Acidobacteriota bacterium]
MSRTRFAVATFQRVFDTTPLQDVVSLEALIGGLTRFIVKPKTQASVARVERQIDAALRTITAGETRAGAAWSALERARAEAAARGDDPRRGIDEAAAHLRAEARAAPKRDLRLWSPTLYVDVAERRSEDVIHLSCLVLDYDSGLSPDDASAAWSDYFHVLHSTWSHTRDHPKYRLVLPLARPVRTADWRTVYDWAEARAGGSIDPSKKGAATTFALPAVADAELPRLARTSSGPLLDVHLEGLADMPAEPPPAVPAPAEPNHFTVPIPGHPTVEGEPETTAQAASARPGQSAETTAPAPSPARRPADASKSETHDASDDDWSFDLF